MVAMVRPLRGSFFAPCAEKPHSKDTHGGDMRREQKRGAAQSLPPLSVRICGGGGKAALGFAPPLCAAGPCAVPWRAGIRPDLILVGQVWPPLARPPPCPLGGVVRRPARLKTPRRAYLGSQKRWGRTRPPWRGRRPFTVRQCAHWHRFLCRLPRPGGQSPPGFPPLAPPRGGKGQSSYSACLPL